jgi:galactokinase
MENLIGNHHSKFDREPQVIASAPGTVHIIGEHTDWNKGLIMPIAVDFRVHVAMSRRRDQALRFYSINYNDLKKTSIPHNKFKREDRWANYIKGVVQSFLNEGYDLGGIDVSVMGNIPEGAGMAASGALEIAAALALQELFELDIDKLDLVCLAQNAETKFMTIPCSVSDQLTPLFSAPGQAMVIDTWTMEHRRVPFHLGDAKIIITNSNVPGGYTLKDFSSWKQDYSRCVSVLSRQQPGRQLRNFSADDISSSLGTIPEKIRKRCLHVVEENQRVLDAEEILERSDLTALGKVMSKSHESMRDLLEISCPELDWLVKRAMEVDGVYGSRMTGSGFGGCTMTVMDSQAVDEYLQNIEGYERIFGFKPTIYETGVSIGAMIECSRLVST